MYADLVAGPVPAQHDATPAEALSARITHLCSCLYAATHRLLELIRAFDRERYWADLGFASCAHWLNFQCGFGMTAARERVRVAHALAGLPKIDAEFASGRLSYSKVRSMTRVATADNEDYLLMIARHGTAWHVEQLVGKYRRVRRQLDDEQAHAVYQSREVSYQFDDDGALLLRARLPADVGMLVVKALDQEVDAAFRESRKQADAPAKQGGESGCSCGGHDPGGRPEAPGPNSDESPDESLDESLDGPPEGRRDHPRVAAAADVLPIATRRADALVRIAESALHRGTASGPAAERYQVVLHVRDEGSHLDGGPAVPVETSRRIACDASVVRVLENGAGEPLSIGRRSRQVTAALRRALLARDGGCRFPGCTHTHHLEAHHIRPWGEDGETSMENLILICSHHHRLIHEGGFKCVRSDSGEVHFESPRSGRLPGVGRLDGVERAAALAWLDRECFDGERRSDACAAGWMAGEPVDWDLAVSLMFQMERGNGAADDRRGGLERRTTDGA